MTDKHLLRAALVCLVTGLALLWAATASAQDRPLHAALVSYAALSVVDAQQTGACLSAGRCVERNALLRPFAGKPSALVAVKLAANSAVAVAIWKLHARHPTAARVLAVTAAIGQAIVVTSNYRQGKRR